MFRLDLNLIPHLHALLEQRSVTAAAVRVNIGQPAMSASLRKLRAHFDDEILVRRGRASELTSLALSLRPVVDEMMALSEEIASVGQHFDPATAQRVFTFGSSDYIRALILPELARILTKEAPHAQIRCISVPTRLDGMLELHRADLIVAPEGYAFDGDHVHLIEDEFILVTDATHPLIRRMNFSLSELGDYPTASVNFGVATPSPLERALDERGLRLRTALTVPSLLDLPRLVLGTELIAFVPSLAVTGTDAILPPGLAALRFPEGQEPNLREAAYWPAGAQADPAREWLLSAVRRAASASSPKRVTELPRAMTAP